jgi:ketosteroid isomerase-like protein
MTAPGAEGVAVAGDRRAAFRALIEKFAVGWNTGEPRRMADAFSVDGVFSPGPFEAPLKGRAAILDYWRDVPLAQTNVSFRYGEVFQAGPWFAVEFKCTYQRRRTGEDVDVRGVLVCETKGDEIADMRMYWDRRVTPRALG